MTEKKINEAMRANEAGSLLLIDIDCFKTINDRYGPLIGDQLLAEISKILSYMTDKEDILGRIGGDEFVIYAPKRKDEAFLEDRGKQIKERLKEIQLQDILLVKLSMTISGSLYRDGDDYREIFNRADQKLLEEKKHKKRGKQGDTKTETEKVAKGKGINIDMRLIRKELAELQLKPGAYCRDYETFKSIYRFVERKLRRNDSGAYTILFTITDGHNNFPPLKKRDSQMTVLKDIVQGLLRSGDVSTRYSSCQLLVLVSDVNDINAEKIAERISHEFYAALDDTEKILLHHCYPLKPYAG